MNLEARHISYAAGTREILHDVSVCFTGGLTALLGPNGAGKTTFLRTLSGFLTPASGEVLLDDVNLRKITIRDRARKIAVVAQNERFEYDFTVLDLVLMGRVPWKRSLEGDNQEDRKIAQTALQDAGISGLAGQSVLTLSGGERQRMTIARAFCQQTPVLLLDEPVSALDIRHQVGILEAVRRYVTQKGLLCIIVLHDLNLAAHYADRLILMKDGRITEDGDADSVLRQDILEAVYETDVRILRDDEELFVLPKMHS